MVVRVLAQDRRRFSREAVPARVAVNLLQPKSLQVSHVNCSEGGLCLRLEQTLEVKSLVRMQVAADDAKTSKGRQIIECTGRVAWVMQRMDLRTMPPFLFDVGIEFVNPPPLLRQLMLSRGGQLAALKGAAKNRLVEPTLLHGRQYLPRLERETNHAKHWHLVVSVDGVPCFSGHYPSERLALAAWVQFKRQQTKRIGH